MRFAEVDLFGVFVAPVAPILLVAWVVLIPLRRLADRTGLFRYVWHPALFLFAVYAALASAIILICGAL